MNLLVHVFLLKLIFPRVLQYTIRRIRHFLGGKTVKIFLFNKVPRWYLGFAFSFFLLLALLPNILDLMSAQSNMPKAVYHGNLSEPKVAFACNVFWGEEYLPQMLDELDKHNIKITFFIGGSWAKRNPQILKILHERGHELGNHTYSHPHPSSLSLEQNKEQITQAENLISEITGVKTTLYAPPYGEFNNTVLLSASELGYTTIMWSIDTVDWKRPPEDVMINRVMKKLHNGAIILIHPTAPTANAMPELIARIKASGYSIVPVSIVLQ
jgi:probable sporulation protein (polysaccharide deacetylase family)